MIHTHFVATVIYRRNMEGDVDFLVVDYQSTNPRNGQKTDLQTKFVGGTNKECPDESVEETRDREVLEEAHLTFLISKEIWRKEVGPFHTKYGFLVDCGNCHGEIRKSVLFDDGDELSPPYWMPAMTLGRVLFHSHQELYMSSVRELGLF